jgi:hypothetical protein
MRSEPRSKSDMQPRKRPNAITGDIRPGYRASRDRWSHVILGAAGCARFPSRSDAVGQTGLDGRPVPVEQEAAATPGPLLLAE